MAWPSAFSLSTQHAESSSSVHPFSCVLCLVCFFCPMCMSSSVHCSFLTRAPFPFRLSCAKKLLQVSFHPVYSFYGTQNQTYSPHFHIIRKDEVEEKRTYQKNIFPYIPFPMKVSLYGYTSFYTCFLYLSFYSPFLFLREKKTCMYGMAFLEIPLWARFSLILYFSSHFFILFFYLHLLTVKRSLALLLQLVVLLI